MKRIEAEKRVNLHMNGRELKLFLTFNMLQGSNKGAPAAGELADAFGPSHDDYRFYLDENLNEEFEINLLQSNATALVIRMKNGKIHPNFFASTGMSDADNQMIPGLHQRLLAELKAEKNKPRIIEDV